MCVYVAVPAAIVTEPLSDSQEERLGYREVILANTFQSLSVVLDAMDDLGIPFSDPAMQIEKGKIVDMGPYPEVNRPICEARRCLC